MKNTGDVNSYLEDGCGRCQHYQTPECKVHQWADALRAIRELVQSTELDEQLKWGSPCYSLDGQNVVMIGAYRDNCVLSFLKGAALPDPTNILEKPGPNTRYSRVVRFRSVDEVRERREALTQLLCTRRTFLSDRVKRCRLTSALALSARTPKRRSDGGRTSGVQRRSGPGGAKSCSKGLSFVIGERGVRLFRTREAKAVDAGKRRVDRGERRVYVERLEGVRWQGRQGGERVSEHHVLECRGFKGLRELFEGAEVLEFA
ncbi:hypothetical protein EA187_03635 [Lujinxingia sediminis]|uniref:YdhG-like domain-containing protein n=1 Tax=Lujinxingia sediminis TaxID=2480984 RepID=A0ABY0CXC9_9DELT|nr:hypothetical protein EA187_03635 [Lujinxingia sediminis]